MCPHLQSLREVVMVKVLGFKGGSYRNVSMSKRGKK